MPHIREVRWAIYFDEDGKEFKPELQQRDGKYGYWRNVPVVKIKRKEQKNDRKKG